MQLATIQDYQQNQKPLDDGSFSLIDLLNFYKDNLSGKTYIFTCEDNLTITLKFNPDNFCHLLFGTVFDNEKKFYAGITGYQRISNEITKIENLPKYLKKKVSNRGASLILLNKLLNKPKLILFNQHLVQNTKIKELETSIKAKYLLYFQTTDGTNLHLFINSYSKNVFVPISFFPNSTDNYIKNQIKFKVKNVSIL